MAVVVEGSGSNSETYTHTYRHAYTQTDEQTEKQADRDKWEDVRKGLIPGFLSAGLVTIRHGLACVIPPARIYGVIGVPFVN